jgi:hypothetical protein
MPTVGNWPARQRNQRKNDVKTITNSILAVGLLLASVTASHAQANFTNVNGTALITDSNSLASDGRFYRAVLR